jgi:hypothetical protein
MRKEKHLSVYSKRWAVGQGAHWRYERDVSPDSRDKWLAIFQRDEPSITFIVSEGRPRSSADSPK